MPISRTFPTLALALGLGATTAAIANGPATAGPKPGQAAGPAGPCPEPDRDTCLSILERGDDDIAYLETTCGITRRESCRQYVDDALEVHGPATAADASVPAREMLRPRKTQMPLHLRQGKYFKFAPKKSVLERERVTQRRRYAKANDLLQGYGGMDAAASPPVAVGATVAPKDAIAFWRDNAWRDNGKRIRSCKEYAYSRSFGAARFIDAASACRGDRECIFDVAYSTGPEGIARPTLENEAGAPMTRQLMKFGGYFQKNDMFVREAAGFVRSNGTAPKQATDSILRLEQALRDGVSWYDIGMCKGDACDDKRHFKDVWAFHKRMHGVNGAVSPAEEEEYERRRAEFRSLLDQWHAAVRSERPNFELPELEQQYVLPLDMRAHDPLLRYQLENEYIDRGNKQRVLLERRFGKQLFEKNAVEALKEIRANKPQQQGSRHVAPAVGVLGMAPASGQASQANPQARAWGLETAKQGPISHKIGKFLRDEWARYEAGQLSCLDPTKQRCDWTMQSFESAVFYQLPTLDAQLADEEFCNDYLDTDTFSDADGPAILTRVHQRLLAAKAEREKYLAEFADHLLSDGTVGRALGSSWTGGDYAGDKDSFGAGYDYDVGWRVEPAKKVAADASVNPGLVCQMKGSVHGDVSFDAHLVGKKFPIVSGSVRVRSEPNDTGDAEVDAYLKFMDVSLYESKQAPWKGTQDFADRESPRRSLDVPDVKPRFDVMVGPVPVSGQVWGELSFGSAIDVGGVANNPAACDPTNLKFGVTAGYTPYFRASGVGQVGVGISGLVSAGIRAAVTLIQLATPVTFGVNMSTKGNKPSVSFDADVDLLLSTLGGRVSLYLEFLLYEEEFELFRWRGVAADANLLELDANVPVQVLK